jgi:hypothetical protein
MNEFEPKLHVLPKAQQVLWHELSAIPEHFVLYGGTAVALHLGHRQSIDFDFFGWQQFLPLELASNLKLLEGAAILQSQPNTLSVMVERAGPIKLSFFGVPRLRVVASCERVQSNGLKISSLLDLLGTKLAVVQQRAEAKDYIDVHAILESRRLDLATGLAAGKTIYGEVFSPQNALKALTYFGEPQLEVLPRGIKQGLVDAVKQINLNKLPEIEEQVV